MGQKDIAEKILFDYDDVFSDIINALLYNGNQVLTPDSLSNVTVHSQYKDEKERLHEQERDVAKVWKDNNVQIALFGIENQSSVEKYLPLRVIGYDGANYKEMHRKYTEEKAGKRALAPVITIVLYFGTKRWSTNKNLAGLLSVPDEFKVFFNDYKINVVEVSWLSEEQIRLFRSDFKIVANFFVKKRIDRNYIPDDKTEIKHVDALLKLLSVMGHDKEYKEIAKKGSKRKVKNMCEVAQRLIKKGKIELLVDLVNDQVLSFSEAAKRADMSEEEFRNKIEDMKNGNTSK